MHSSITTTYWVIAADGTLADTDCVAALPGASAAPPDTAVAIETPVCDGIDDLRVTFIEALRTTVEAAHEMDCRLVPLGVRPDLLHRHPPTTAGSTLTAGSQLTIETDPDLAIDQYNTLMALDPAFALVNTVSCRDQTRQYACGRPFMCRKQTGLDHRHQQQLYAYAKNTASWATQLGNPVEAGGQSALRRAHDTRQAADSQLTEPAHWSPVEFSTDKRRLRWNSPDTTTPTVLFQLVSNVTSVLRRAATQPIEVAAFGNGCCAGRIILPSAEWLATYREQALKNGIDSLLVRAYLERFCFDTTWYQQSRPTPTIGSLTPSAAADHCLDRASQLEAELGYITAN